MKVCAIDTKECWRDAAGCWQSNGGFPLQMQAIASLFEEMDLLIVGSEPKEGGLPLPREARVIPFRRPHGDDTRRKISVVLNLRYYLGEIVRYCREADVVHVPPPGDLQFLGMIAALWLKKPLLVRYCGSWQRTAQTTMMNRVTRWMMRSFAGGRNVMLATGGGETPPAKGVSWIFASALREAELASIQTDLDRKLYTPPRLIYAGRLSPEKGVANLIAAISSLRQEGFEPLPRVTLAGDGPQRLELEALIRESNCTEHIRLVGQLNRHELSRCFLASDLCVQPSLTEGFSKAWLDAMAHAVPVLATDVGAARSVIGTEGERGWIIPPGDVKALSQQLKQILRSPINWRDLRANCRNFVQAQTLESWAQTIGQNCARQWNLQFVEGKLSPHFL
jgi:glycosyltransferase involved in cell wall biosynthesis